jgi:hypothetical protein
MLSKKPGPDGGGWRRYHLWWIAEVGKVDNIPLQINFIDLKVRVPTGHRKDAKTKHNYN